MTTPYSGNNWIDQLPPEARQATLERMRLRRFNKGEVIYTEGRVHASLWQVNHGSVRVTNETPEGKEVVFVIFSQGDCFGELTLLDGQPASNTATAQEQVALMELAKADFDALYLEYPVIANQLTRLLCARVRHLMYFYADAALRPLEQQMASRVLYLRSEHMGVANSEELQFTQQELANMLGATRQAVSKVLNSWREQNLIALEYGKITMLEPSLLEAVARGVKS
jgi:CRP/FNR family cyclic AMP-dependent transcriptional regulator